MSACLSWASVGHSWATRGPVWATDCQRQDATYQFVVGMVDKIVATGPCDAPGCGRSDDGVRYRWAKKPELDGKQVCSKSACQDWGGTRDLEKEKAARQAKAAAAKAAKEAAKAAEAATKAAETAGHQAAAAAFDGARVRAAAGFTASAPAQAERQDEQRGRGTRLRRSATYDWDAQRPVAARHRSWEDLSGAERATAGSLGFEQWSWDASVLGLDDDVDEWAVPRLKAHGLGLAGWSLDKVHAILGVRFHNPVEMTEAQRIHLADAETHPCFLVCGDFDNDEDVITTTRWVHFDRMGRHAVDYLPEDESERGDDEEYTRAIDAYRAAHERLWRAARAKYVAEVDADKAAAAAAAAAAGPRKGKWALCSSRRCWGAGPFLRGGGR